MSFTFKFLSKWTLCVALLISFVEVEPVALAEDTDVFSAGSSDDIQISKPKKKKRKKKRRKRKRLSDSDSYTSADDSDDDGSGPLAAFKKFTFRVGGVYMKYSPDAVNGAITDINNNAVLSLDSKIPPFSSTFAGEAYAGYKLLPKLEAGPFVNFLADEKVTGSNTNTLISVEESIQFMAFGVKLYYFFHAKENFGLFISPAFGLGHFKFKDIVVSGKTTRTVEASAFGTYFRTTIGATYLLFPSLGSFFEVGFQGAKSGDMVVDSVSQTTAFKVGDGITFKDGDGTIDLSGLVVAAGITFQL